MTAGLSGIFPMLVTPFDESGAVALDELSSVTNYQLRAGVSGVSLLGLAAEAETLTVDNDVYRSPCSFDSRRYSRHRGLHRRAHGGHRIARPKGC